MSIEAFPELGHYVVGDVAVFTKPAALELARTTGGPLRYIFPMPTSPDEPTVSLADLYLVRALELRDRFDYLVLMYSGGADSHQMLMTFLNNNIRIDEVMSFYPMALVNSLPNEVPAWDDPLVLLYEYRLSAVDGLNQVTLRQPSALVTVVDTTPILAGLDQNWVADVSLKHIRLSGGMYNSAHRWTEVDTLRRRAESVTGTMAAVYASDKPAVFSERGKVTIGYNDLQRSGFDAFNYLGEPNYRPVMFFLCEPQIAVKQAHVIKRAVEANPEAMAWVAAHGNEAASLQIDGGCPGIDLQIIYPDWPVGRFRARKSRNEGIARAINPSFEGLTAERINHIRSTYGSMPGVGDISVEFSGRPLVRVFGSSFNIGVLGA